MKEMSVRKFHFQYRLYSLVILMIISSVIVLVTAKTIEVRKKRNMTPEVKAAIKWLVKEEKEQKHWVIPTTGRVKVPENKKRGRTRVGCKPMKNDAQTTALEIANGLHVADENDLQTFRDTRAKIHEKLNSKVVKQLVQVYWDDSRPSAIDTVWATYPITAPGVPLPPKGGTVGGCLYFIFENLTFPAHGKVFSSEELKVLLIKCNYDLDVAKKIREQEKVPRTNGTAVGD